MFNVNKFNMYNLNCIITLLLRCISKEKYETAVLSQRGNKIKKLAHLVSVPEVEEPLTNSIKLN